jgi:hypothetical protein
MATGHFHLCVAILRLPDPKRYPPSPAAGREGGWRICPIIGQRFAAIANGRHIDTA